MARASPRKALGMPIPRPTEHPGFCVLSPPGDRRAVWAGESPRSLTVKQKEAKLPDGSTGGDTPQPPGLGTCGLARHRDPWMTTQQKQWDSPSETSSVRFSCPSCCCYALSGSRERHVAGHRASQRALRPSAPSPTADTTTARAP